MKNRVWVYLSDKPLSGALEQSLRADIEAFLMDWNAHGTALDATCELYHNHFIIIKADEEKFAASGCSIDKQLRFIKQAEQKYGLSLLNRLLVAYKTADGIQVISSAQVPQLLANGTINENTLVFNLGVGNESELASAFEIPLRQSWLAKFLQPVK